MPHIDLPEGFPGISAGFTFAPKPPSPCANWPTSCSTSPTRSRRASANSSRPTSPRATSHLLPAEPRGRRIRPSRRRRSSSNAGQGRLSATAPISPKLKALLVIAGKVQQDGKLVTSARCRSRAPAGRDRHRNSRHRAHRRRLLHVQPLRRRPRHLAAHRPRHVRADGPSPGQRGLQSFLHPPTRRRRLIDCFEKEFPRSLSRVSHPSAATRVRMGGTHNFPQSQVPGCFLVPSPWLVPSP